MGKDCSVDRQTLHEHAEKVDQNVVTKVRKAAQAADQVDFGGDEAYGKLLVHLIPPVVKACLGDAAKGLESAAVMGETIANAVRTCAQSYEQIENDASALLKKFETDGALRR